ncbi:hypothetical protein KZ829_22320 [Actinoplanes hulinensis]|uniref:Uncharacterized protein n=1 Tax=Actinoplanes hulinensis TaxID=1144547 RepID=A0ABS7B646_9ACTN|nr:hypothetical protein [Actinoplanes hulinensis]MBW6436481.1 hypothetical protein [Actinoplanes hulinensis]
MANEQTLTVDLANLWEAGALHLPAIAQQYAAARERLAVNEAQDGYFWRPADFMGGGYGPVREALVHVRDAMASVFLDSEANVEETGRALVRAAEVYGDIDVLNAELIRRGNKPDPATFRVNRA